MEETTPQAIRRLQQQIYRVDDQIASKRERLTANRFTGCLRRQIEIEIEELIERRSAICRNILQLKNLELTT